MIKLERVRTKKAIPSSFRDKEPRKRLVELMMLQQEIVKDPAKKHKFASRWGVTKKQLLKETHGKCAYCEAPTSLVAHGDVEHYRPKSEYWWLAYVYDNYLASCQLCNQSFKKANFPILPGGKKMSAPRIGARTAKSTMEKLAKKVIPDPLDASAVAKFEKLHSKEHPAIPNPYIDDPAELIGWRVREGIRQVDVIPHPDHPDAAPIALACVDFLGLNRDELRRERFKLYSIYKTFRDLRDSPGMPDNAVQTAQQMIDSLRTSDSGFAGMIRYLDG